MQLVEELQLQGWDVMPMSSDFPRRVVDKLWAQTGVKQRGDLSETMFGRE